MSEPPPRPLPAINEMNRYFWCGGADGRLHIMRCQSCGYWIHPYAAGCPKCASTEVRAEPVSGRGRILCATINTQVWTPKQAEPYAIALVGLEEQESVRLLTNIEPIEAAVPGAPVDVAFEQHDEVFIPFFKPVRT